MDVMERGRKCMPGKTCFALMAHLVIMLITLNGDHDMATATKLVYFISTNMVNDISQAKSHCENKNGQLLNLNHTMSDFFLKKFRQALEPRDSGNTYFTDLRYIDDTFFWETECIEVPQDAIEYATISLDRDHPEMKKNEAIFQLQYEPGEMNEIAEDFKGAWGWEWEQSRVICQAEMPGNCSFISKVNSLLETSTEYTRDMVESRSYRTEPYNCTAKCLRTLNNGSGCWIYHYTEATSTCALWFFDDPPDYDAFIVDFPRGSELQYKDCVEVDFFTADQTLMTPPDHEMCLLSWSNQRSKDATSTQNTTDGGFVVGQNEPDTNPGFLNTQTESTKPLTTKNDPVLGQQHEPDRKPEFWRRSSKITKQRTTENLPALWSKMATEKPPNFSQGSEIFTASFALGTGKPMIAVAQSPVTETNTFTSEIGTTDLQTKSVDKQNICECICPKGGDETIEQKDEFTKEVLAKLTIDTMTKAQLAKYASAPDNRASAQNIGCFGAVFLSVFLSIPVLFDLVNVIIYFSKPRTKSKLYTK